MEEQGEQFETGLEAGIHIRDSSTSYLVNLLPRFKVATKTEWESLIMPMK